MATATGTHFSTFAGNFYYAADPPDNPQNGQAWFDTDTNQLFIYYDGNWWAQTFTTSTSSTSTSTSTSSTSTSTSSTSTSTSTT